MGSPNPNEWRSCDQIYIANRVMMRGQIVLRWQLSAVSGEDLEAVGHFRPSTAGPRSEQASPPRFVAKRTAPFVVQTLNPYHEPRLLGPN